MKTQIIFLMLLMFAFTSQAQTKQITKQKYAYTATLPWEDLQALLNGEEFSYKQAQSRIDRDTGLNDAQKLSKKLNLQVFYTNIIKHIKIDSVLIANGKINQHRSLRK